MSIVRSSSDPRRDMSGMHDLCPDTREPVLMSGWISGKGRSSVRCAHIAGPCADTKMPKLAASPLSPRFVKSCAMRDREPTAKVSAPQSPAIK